MSEWLAQNWEYVLVVIYALEKIVKITPTKYDDIVFDMILKPIKDSNNLSITVPCCIRF